MNFSEKMKSFFDQSVKASKDIVKQAGDKAQQWGEMGVLKIEIGQLRNQMAKLTAQLGVEVFETFIDKGQKSLSRESPAIKELLDKLCEIDKQIDEKEEAYKNAGGKEADIESPKDEGTVNPEAPKE